MSVEKDAFDELIEMEVLPADSWYVPSKHEANYSPRLSKKRANLPGDICLMGGVRGMFKKSLSPPSSF